MTATARVHGGDQLDIGGKAHMRVGPCHFDRAGFERLPQRIEHGALELGQFVEKQHTQMGKADLAGLYLEAAAGKRGHAGRMMRRPERARARDAPVFEKPATDCTMLTSSVSAGDSAGRMPGRQLASSDLPAPGGPIISRL